MKKIKLTTLFKDFFESEKAGGVVLVFVTLFSLFLGNSPFQSSYLDFWNANIGGHSVVHWINDGLMTIFFLLIGLELEREIYHGELSDLKAASLPLFGAMGGMLVPAGIFFLLNYGKETQAGAGIPMATDIAFAIGILSLLGNRVPASLKIFLTALAVIDDLGAILVIAIFYTQSIAIANLFIALGIFGFMLLLNRLKVFSLFPYLIGGLFMWFFMLQSGVHATISGVLLAFAIPFGNGSPSSPSYRLQHVLHKPVAFLVLPLFALANTSISFSAHWVAGLSNAHSVGIICGLVAGKPIGIVLFTFLGVGLGICTLPKSLNWKRILGAGFLGGIGFTMSIFITLLAFDQQSLITESKIAILLSSAGAGVLGFFWLFVTLRKSPEAD